jgi:hypothetical protein
MLTYAHELAAAHARELERKLRECEHSEEQLRRRLHDAERRLQALQEQRLVDIKSSETVLRDTGMHTSAYVSNGSSTLRSSGMHTSAYVSC